MLSVLTAVIFGIIFLRYSEIAYPGGFEIASTQIPSRMKPGSKLAYCGHILQFSNILEYNVNLKHHTEILNVLEKELSTASQAPGLIGSIFLCFIRN